MVITAFSITTGFYYTVEALRDFWRTAYVVLQEKLCGVDGRGQDVVYLTFHFLILRRFQDLSCSQVFTFTIFSPELNSSS